MTGNSVKIFGPNASQRLGNTVVLHSVNIFNLLAGLPLVLTRYWDLYATYKARLRASNIEIYQFQWYHYLILGNPHWIQGVLIAQLCAFSINVWDQLPAIMIYRVLGCGAGYTAWPSLRIIQTNPFVFVKSETWPMSAIWWLRHSLYLAAHGSAISTLAGQDHREGCPLFQKSAC